MPQLAHQTTEQLLDLTQAICRNGIENLLGLTVVTSGIQSPSIGLRGGLSSSAAWGLGRVIAAELPDLHFKLVDFDRKLTAAAAAEQLAAEVIPARTKTN